MSHICFIYGGAEYARHESFIGKSFFKLSEYILYSTCFNIESVQRLEKIELKIKHAWAFTEI